MLKAIKTLAILMLSARVVCGQAFTFSDIPFMAQGGGIITNVLLWLKADAITGYTDGQSLSNWVDSGQFSQIVTQGVSAVRPIYVASALNSLPAVKFIASQTNFFLMPANLFFTSNSAELFVVVKANADPATNATPGIWNFASTATFPGCHYPFTDGFYYESFCSATQGMTISPIPLLAEWRLLNLSSTNFSWIARLDYETIHSTAAVLFTNAVGISNTNRWIGKTLNQGYAFDGQLAEIILYGRITSGAERTNIQNYLNAKYRAIPPSPFFPTNVPGNLFEQPISAAAWYEPSRAAYVTNGGIATLPNLTSVGSLFNFTNVAGTITPSAQVAQLNGFDTIFFDGVNDRLDCAVMVAAQPYECFLVFATTNLGFGSWVWSMASAANGLRMNDPAAFTINASGAGALATKSVTNKYHVADFLAAGASSLIVTNNVTGATGTAGNPGGAGLSGVKLGARNDNAIPGNMSVASLIIFTNRILSPTQRSNVYFYCTNRFGPFP